MKLVKAYCNHVKKFLVLLTAIMALMLSSCSTNSEDSSPNPIETPAQSAQDSTDSIETQNSTPESKKESNKKKSSDVDLEAPANKEQAGNYLTLQEFENSKDQYGKSDVVLFFNANWCSTCKIARDNIESNLNSIPSNLTIVVVDFDKETDLRKKYGVTIQHSFVQIDENGNELAKWSGSVTAKEIAEKTV